MSLNLEALSGGYDSGLTVAGIHLTLEPGEWLSLVGANGSGKSTLLKLISRILPLQAGRVLLDGKAIHQQPPQVVARQMALLPQQTQVPIGLAVWDLVSLGRTPYQSWWQWQLSAEDRQQVEQALTLTQLQADRDRPVAHLSGGERQRAFLALALAQTPQVLLLDEPTTYLDLRHQLELLTLLKSLNQQQGLTILTVLHDLNLAIRYSDRLAMLRTGQLWAVGEPETVLNDENLAAVFGLQAARVQTPVGLQLYPVAPVESSFPVDNFETRGALSNADSPSLFVQP
ncbi:ATP-binding cassette domain-containing protein [Synechococcales cyanobacterium C]|uniref:ATP-binding cassette domain-containing protein n=1 Tax=Petrachloros mirabilis ULC683 TaxID=2781853 RepID=A0A8K1ZZR1_9CYAN|nr:ABC transporter ATP-binding protein [Petrachloros mirabilis]NCJ07818.1 ATP-binding cassette domain-containing protein [Petrachloros mirabilis ULC683]